MKTCSKCGEDKPQEAFYAHSGNQCRACKVRASEKWRRANPERFTANQRSRNQHPDVKLRRAAYLRQYNLDNKDELAVKQRARTILRKYGLTADQFDAMLEAQDSRCAICGKREPLAVDHDHQSGAVRALLCRACNTTIGLLEEDPVRMRTMAQYVEQHRKGLTLE